MHRRSERIPKIIANDSDYEEVDDEEVLENETQGRGRKRKVKGSKANNGQPPVKKARGKRGVLKQIVEMPLDLLFEIFGKLEPIDLLNMARTTKDLRALLMTRSSSTIWKASLSNVPALPECPEDLTEPEYVNLVFGKGCHFCLRNLGAIHTVWAARVKTCNKCVPVHFTREGYFICPEKLKGFLPKVTISQGKRRACAYFSKALCEDWTKQFSDCNDHDAKAKWLSDMVAKRQAIDEHVTACTNWARNEQLLREKKQNDLLDQRKAEVVERIKQLGWEEEFEKFPLYSSKPQEDPFVLKLCQKGLTDQILPTLDEFLNKVLEDAKAKRLQKEYNDLLNERIPILDSFVNTYTATFPVNSIHPTTLDLFRMPVIRDIITNTPRTEDFSVQQFNDLISMMPDLILRWQDEIEDKLINLMSTACGSNESNFDRKSVFNLATTWFSCGQCSTKLMRHSQALIHSCATKRDYGNLHHQDEDRAVFNVLSRTYWNANQPITFNFEIFKLMTKVVQKCGFDPEVATFEEVDKGLPIIECISCNSVYEGRATFVWWELADHLKALHRMPMKFEVLDGQEAERARNNILEKRERKMASQYNRPLICVYCKETGNAPDLTQHVKKQHGKSKPTEEDMKIILDSSEHVGIYRLWPPREREEAEPEIVLN